MRFSFLRAVIKRWQFVLLCTSLALTNYGWASDAEWSAWLQQQIQQHPDVIAARERMNAALANADALAAAEFNPELDTEFEREGDADNYRIGFSQRIDLWNARGSRKRQATFERISADQLYQRRYQQKLADTLLLLIEFDSATEQAAITLQQETQIETLINLLERRRQAGDVGEADSALSYLSLSQQLNNATRSQVNLKRVAALLRAALPELSLTTAAIPEVLWQVPSLTDIEQLVEKHPLVIAAKAKADALQQMTSSVRRSNKSSPTLGLNAGKEGEDDVVGLTLSIPLNIRNNYGAQVKMAEREALAAEADYRAERLRQRALLEATFAEFEQLQQSQLRWQSRVAERIETSGDLLKQQWQSGDMSTADYLLALQQRSDSLLAGVELLRDRRRSQIQWMLQSGQLLQILNSI